jgi:DNA polymerase-3 subunit gamma/tau
LKNSSEVLARKYRPVTFDELIGQESVSQTLSLALDTNRLSHAYLFSGLRGSGKTSTARIFAKALLCEKGISHKPCQTCQSCVMASEGRHIDIIEMDAASNRGIDDIRELIEQTKYRPASSRFKIFIIDEVHMLTPQAFNALLKTLEEPPSFVKFILATTDPLKLPATILSRTQHFRFKSIAQNKIVEHLAHILNIESIKYEKEALEILSRSGGGSLRDTLTLLDQAIIYSKSFVDVTTVTDMLGLVDPKFISELFDAVFSKNYTALLEQTAFLQEYEPEMVINELIAYLKDKMYLLDPRYSTLVLDRFFRILSESKQLLSINADGSFVLSLIFFKMVEALKIKEVDEMIESLQKEIYTHSTPYNTHRSMQKDSDSLKEEDSVLQNIIPKKEAGELKSFENLVLKIKDRNFELGECFSKSIKFISFEDSVLSWESCADDECKKTLTHGYGVIKQLVREIFGFETKIKHETCQKAEEQEELCYEDTASMIEDAEIGGSFSCITQPQSSQTSTKEINGAEILEEPMVQKAIEYFEAKKVTIQSKI